MKQTLIADSGSTKTDWAWCHDGVVTSVQTDGINPIVQSKDMIKPTISALTEQISTLADFSPSTDLAIYFYGAGCTPEKKHVVAELLQEHFPTADITVESDLLAAAHALCQHNEGIACILGTGANSCYYDGKEIVQNTPALGFILGDEGGGAVLGKNFVNHLYKGVFNATLLKDFEEWSGLNMPLIIEKVYRSPMPNRFLASLVPFIAQHIDNQQVRAFVVENFRLFIQRNIHPYNKQHLPIGFVGSIAYYFREQLAEAVNAECMMLGRIEKAPLQLLVQYYHCITLTTHSSRIL